MKSYKEFSEEAYQLDEARFRWRNPFGGGPKKGPKKGPKDTPDGGGGKGKKGGGGGPVAPFLGGAAGNLAGNLAGNIANFAKDMLGKALKTDEGDEKKSAASSGLKAVEKHT